MVEGSETPRPRRAFSTDDSSGNDREEVRGRRGVWPEADQDEEPAPVSRRAWTEPEPTAEPSIQQVSAPARRVMITPAQTADDSAEPDDSTRLQPDRWDDADDAAPVGRRGHYAVPPTAAVTGPEAGGSPADGAPSDQTVLRGGDQSAQEIPDDQTVLRSAPAQQPRGGQPPAEQARAQEPQHVGPTAQGPTAQSSPAQSPATPARPGTPASAAGPASAPTPAAAPDDATVMRPPPMPTLQPPTYANQPAPAPQEPAPESVGPVPAAKIAGPPRPPSMLKNKGKRGTPTRAKEGHLVEWDAPTDSSLDKRTRFSLSLAGVAALVIIAVAIGYAVISGRDPGVATEPPQGSETPGVTRPPEPFPSERMMLTDTAAKQISDQPWKVSLTQDGLTDESPRPTCVRLSVDGAPVPRATMLRTLTTGDDGATALHVVDTYGSAEEAAQVFASRATQLGACDKEPTLITGGYTVSDVGNEATGITTEVQDDKGIRHTILITRTGTAVNIIDIAQPKQPVSMSGVVKAMAGVVDAQCNAAVGLCSLTPKIAQAPPPADGGDPGFLSTADIPRITSGAGSWSANPATTEVNVIGSQCEGVSSWSAVKNADDSRQTTFLLMDDPASPTAFGMDEVLLSMNSQGAAKTFVADFKKSMDKCSDRMLTAKVSKAEPITGHGAGGAEVSGYAYNVTQKSGKNDVKYRVGIVASNSTVAYLVLPIEGEFDFSDAQWKQVVSRAGERASQVR
ncbi:hypothetical protein [Enemella sp. A6]|uniref:hypothetical protein n=1 Tax=Enemella sp. A6 TaxID=3440152 RepID=UPI003EC0A75F